MYKKLLLVLAVSGISLGGGLACLDASKSEASKSGVPTSDADSVWLEAKYAGNRYTRPETPEPSPLPVGESFAGYEKMAENQNLVLYAHPQSLAVKIMDKRTHYVWNSGLEDPTRFRLNQTWKEMAQSAITIDYIDRTGKERSESILTEDARPQISKTSKGFRATVFFAQAKIEMVLEAALEEDSLLVSIPEQQIREGPYNKLISLKLYPFLGAVNEAEINGYMFIPDGSGALIRYQKDLKADAPFIGPIYGQDAGFLKTISNGGNGTVSPEQIRMPVFGAVHGVNQNGFLAVIEDGTAYGQIIAYPAGVSTDFNWISSQFQYRYQYFQPTSKSMNGITIYQENKNRVNIQLRYMFLAKEQANYVGMAKRYQRYLLEKGQLPKAADEVAVRLEFLGGETKKGLFWDSVVPMTEIHRLPAYVQELKAQGIMDIFVVYRSWSKGGLTGTLPAKFPVEKKVGGKQAVIGAIQALQQEKVPLYFYTDYTKAFQGASGFSGRTDVAKKISSETIFRTEQNRTVYYLTPAKSLEYAAKDIAKYKEYGISQLAVDTSGYILFSDFNKQAVSPREKTLETYQNVFRALREKVGNLLLYRPNVYAWKFTDRYLDIPMDASNYLFASDTVPFLQIVLKGYLPYYAPFSNFYAEREDEVLRMIEYGAYPSFYLTAKPPYLLAKTPSKDLYTSEFDVWKPEIVRQYKLVQESLGQVAGATIANRQVLAAGVVEVAYSNGKSILVNYTNSPFNAQGVEIGAKRFVVTDRGNKR